MDIYWRAITVILAAKPAPTPTYSDHMSAQACFAIFVGLFYNSICSCSLSLWIYHSVLRVFFPPTHERNGRLNISIEPKKKAISRWRQSFILTSYTTAFFPFLFVSFSTCRNKKRTKAFKRSFPRSSKTKEKLLNLGPYIRIDYLFKKTTNPLILFFFSLPSLRNHLSKQPSDLFHSQRWKWDLGLGGGPVSGRTSRQQGRSGAPHRALDCHAELRLRGLRAGSVHRWT